MEFLSIGILGIMVSQTSGFGFWFMATDNCIVDVDRYHLGNCKNTTIQNTLWNCFARFLYLSGPNIFLSNRILKEIIEMNLSRVIFAVVESSQFIEDYPAVHSKIRCQRKSQRCKQSFYTEKILKHSPNGSNLIIFESNQHICCFREYHTIFVWLWFTYNGTKTDSGWIFSVRFLVSQRGKWEENFFPLYNLQIFHAIDISIIRKLVQHKYHIFWKKTCCITTLSRWKQSISGLDGSLSHIIKENKTCFSSATSGYCTHC